MSMIIIFVDGTDPLPKQIAAILKQWPYINPSRYLNNLVRVKVFLQPEVIE